MYTHIIKQEFSASDFRIVDIGNYRPCIVSVRFKILDIEQYEEYSVFKIEMSQVERDDIGLEVYDGDNKLGNYAISFKATILLRIQNKYIDELIRKGILTDVPVEGLDTLKCKITNYYCISGDTSLNEERLKKLLDLDNVHETLDYVSMFCEKISNS